MNNKKILLMLVLLVACLLAACGNNEEKNEKNEANATTAPTKAEDNMTDTPTPEVTEPVVEDDSKNIDLKVEYVRTVLNESLTKFLEGKGAEVAAHAPSFTPESWLKDSRYTKTEANNKITEFAIDEIEFYQYLDKEEILKIYNFTELGFDVESEDALKDVQSLTIVRYTYKYKNADGKEIVESPESGSDFLMAFENGEWKYVFEDQVPDSIANYILNQKLEKYYNTYKLKEVKHYEKGELVSESYADFAKNHGYGEDAWTFEFNTRENEAGDEFLFGSLQGEGDECTNIYGMNYADFSTANLVPEYDGGDDRFLDYKVTYYRITFDIAKETFTVKITDSELHEFSLVFGK